MTFSRKSGILRRCKLAMDKRAERGRVAGMKTTETFGRYEITVEGPDPMTRDCYWVRVESNKAKLGRTPNNFVHLAKSLELSNAKVADFKAGKTRGCK